MLTNNYFNFISLAQTVSPTADTAHQSIGDLDVETVSIPRPGNLPTAIWGDLVTENAGCSEYYVSLVAQNSIDTVAPKRNK